MKDTVERYRHKKEMERLEALRLEEERLRVQTKETVKISE